MIAKCFNCGNFIFRYMCNTYKNPCENCGCTLFFICHLGLNGVNHWFLRDVANEINLSEDLCDIRYPKLRGEDEVTEMP